MITSFIVADHNRRVDDRPWKEAATQARNQQHRIVCGPIGVDRNELAAEYRRANPLAGVPPGSILRPRYE
jgi:hypothetical protein